jgi:uracil-DNA glycosylase family 4
MSKEEKQKLLDSLKKKMLKDESLPLRKGATNLVFGEGNPGAEIFCLGEGPGYWEDQKARPFVGNAGGLLNQLLSSIKIPREEVFITNVVCYRPPENRDPTPEEMAAFEPYINKMIEVINPKVILTLGRFSMGKFLPGVKISAVHGKPHEVNWKGKNLLVVPMYHPAAALRNGQVLYQEKQDFLKLPEILAEYKNKKEEKKVEIVQGELI